MAWNARYVVGNRESDRVFLYFTNTNWDYNAEITHVDVPHIDRCQFGAWNLAVNKISIADDYERNTYYVAYCGFDTSDCSVDNEANGEIYIQKSLDRGGTWSIPENVTNSHTPGCAGPNCASDIYPSMAERINNNDLHIFYECYRGFDNAHPENESPMLYLRKQVSPLFNADEKPLPTGFELAQNYPNPFNAKTTIKYSLKERSGIAISIYNVTGEKVAVLFEGMQEAGEHQAVWDASKYSSGIYFAKMETGEKSQTVKIVLLK